MVAAREERAIALPGGGSVGAIWVAPPHARVAYLLAHGAGAGMRHPFMEGMAAALAERGVANLRYQFPYAQEQRRRPDPPALLHAAVRAAAAELARLAPRDAIRIAGGKSMGGRMTSQAQALEPLPGIRGLAFLGFPLHPAGKPGTDRAKHLADVALPMLFLQGTRDELADLDLLRPIVDGLGARATLSIVEGADHGFKVPKARGTASGVRIELAGAVASWAERLP